MSHVSTAVVADVPILIILSIGDYVDSAIWSAAEPCMGVISACIPSLRPLVSLVFRGTVRGHDVTKATKSAQATTSSGSSRMMWPSRTRDEEREGQFTRLEDGINEGKRPQWGHDVSVHGGKKAGRGAEDEISLEEMNVPDGAIKVKDEIVVTSSNWLDYKDKVY